MSEYRKMGENYLETMPFGMLKMPFCENKWPSYCQFTKGLSGQTKTELSLRKVLCQEFHVMRFC